MTYTVHYRGVQSSAASLAHAIGLADYLKRKCMEPHVEVWDNLGSFIYAA